MRLQEVRATGEDKSDSVARTGSIRPIVLSNYPCRSQLSAQPLATIEHDVHVQRQPRLDSHLRESQSTILSVNIIVQTLPQSRYEVQMFRLAIAEDIKALASLDGLKHGN